jgi:hypothetical protein
MVMLFNEKAALLRPDEKALLDEGQELMKKIEALSAFLKTPLYEALPQTDQILLAAQQSAMSAYLNVLSLRVLRFGQ